MDVPDLGDAEPEAIDLGIVLGDPGDAPPPPPAYTPASTPAAAPTQVARFDPYILGRLPWYYGFLGVLAKLGVLCGVLSWAFGFIVVFGTKSESRPGPSGEGLVLFFYSIAVGISLMIVPALILLALDVGKSLREMICRLAA
jgi:hypothetical protein